MAYLQSYGFLDTILNCGALRFGTTNGKSLMFRKLWLILDRPWKSLSAIISSVGKDEI